MQWKGLDWPVMLDSLNLMGVSAVPITLFLDEQGIIRAVRPKIEDLGEFLAKDFSAGTTTKQEAQELPDLAALKKRSQDGKGQNLKEYAEALFLWGGRENLDESIERFEDLLRRSPGDGPFEFSLGVVYRRRYDEDPHDSEDFLKAVEHWGRALELNPNQYIWRRRIQQYGPRLDKPYSFYDWVGQARSEILERGELPLPLQVEPGGAELAYPTDSVVEEGPGQAEPDPRNRVLKDQEGLIKARAVVVPNTSDGERSARVHVLFSPDRSKKAHWNNEAGNMQVWLSPTDNLAIDKTLEVIEVPPEEVTREIRKAEFEVRSDSPIRGALSIPGYALYYVCEDLTGTCLYRRLDFAVKF